MFKKCWKIVCCMLLVASAVFANLPAKNVILFIGDGMGPNQRTAARAYLGRSLAMDSDITTFYSTYSANNEVTDSAAGATALATGHKTNNGYLSISPSGEKLTTILELAKKQGMKTGLVATSTITHATPAAFAAHRISRNDEVGVALDFLENKVDLLLGGGRNVFLPTDQGGKRTDGRNLVAEFQALGYIYVENGSQLNQLSSLPALCLLADDGFPYAIENDGSVPTMREMTQKALELLSQSETGFFLMVEGSQIDWACHANEPAAALYEVAAFDEAVAAALEFLADNPDTLIVVCADHETGGLIMEDAEPGVLRQVRTSSRMLASLLQQNPTQAREVFYQYTGFQLSDEELEQLLQANIANAISQFLSKKAGLKWQTTDHSAAKVPLTAFGAGAELFYTIKDNTDVPKIIASLMGIPEYAVKVYVSTLASGFPVPMFDLNKDEGTSFEQFNALSTLNNMLEGAVYLDKIETDSQINAYKFALQQGEQMIVLWTEGNPETLGIKTAGTQASMVDLFGNRYPLSPVNGIITVTASDRPIYLLGDFSDAVISKPGFSLRESSMNIPAGETVTIELVSMEKISDADRLEVDLPSGWIVKEKGIFSEGNSQARLVVQLPGGIDKKAYQLPIYLLGKQRVLGHLIATINVEEPLELSVSPWLREPGNWEKWDIAVTVTNRVRSRATSGTVKIQLDDPAVQAESFAFTLAPNEQHTFTLPLQTLPTDHVRVVAEVSSTDGDQIAQERKVSFLAAVKRKAPLVVDGEITEVEWGGTMPFYMNQAGQIQDIKDWGGAADLSGTGYLQWDDEYLYLAVAATDDVFCQDGTGSNIWSGDSVQFVIDPARNRGVGRDGYHELGFALGHQDAIGWRWIATYKKSVGPLPDTVKLAVKRKGNITSYEAAIPWSELVVQKPAPGSVIGFSLLINDNDGAGRRGWIEYMSGIGGTKDPDLFGDLLLVE